MLLYIMYLKHVKQFLRESFLECNVINQIKISITIGLILLIMRQFDNTYLVESNQYLKDLKSMILIITFYCGTKLLYNQKHYKTAYLGMFFTALYVCLVTTVLYKRWFVGKYQGNYIDSNDVYTKKYANIYEM